MHTNSQNRAYSVENFGEAFGGFSRAYIYKEIAAGRLKARKIGRRRVIMAEEGEAWLNSRSQDAA